MKNISLLIGQTLSDQRFKIVSVVYLKIHKDIFIRLHNSLGVEEDLIVNDASSLSSLVFLTMSPKKLYQ